MRGTYDDSKYEKDKAKSLKYGKRGIEASSSGHKRKHEKRNGKKGNNMNCFNCGNPGHFARCHNSFFGYSPIHNFFSLKKNRIQKNQKNIIKKYNTMSKHPKDD